MSELKTFVGNRNIIEPLECV